MLGRNVNGYFSNYTECMQNIPCLLQEHISAALHSNTVQNRLFHEIENSSLIIKDSNNIEHPISELMSSLFMLNDIYDGRINEINKLEERLEQLSQFMLSSKAAICSDDRQQLRQLTRAFRHSKGDRRHGEFSEDNYFDASTPREPTSPFSTPKRKPHRTAFRRSTSELLLRGTKWMNAGKRRSRASNEINHRGLPAGAIVAQFRRNKYQATLGRMSGKSSSYLLQRVGVKNRGMSSGGSRIAAQQSRNIITVTAPSRRLKGADFRKGLRQRTCSLASDDSVDEQHQQVKIAIPLSERSIRRLSNDCTTKEDQRFNQHYKIGLDGDDSVTDDDDEDNSSVSNGGGDTVDEQIRLSGGCSSPLPYTKSGYKPTYSRRSSGPRAFSKRAGAVSGRRGPSTNSPKSPSLHPSTCDDDDSEDDQSTLAGTPAMGISSGGGGSSERLYCLCKKVSFGEMIACDNTRCEIEWFHFGCVEIRVQPKGKWYCPRCRGDTSKIKRIDL